MAKKELDNKLKEAIDAEVAPIKESVSKLTAENEGLSAKNAELQKENERLLEAVSKIKTLNGKLLSESRTMAKRAKLASERAKEKFEEEKQRLIEVATSKLEKHVNEISSAAFNSARVLFEKDFSDLESNVLTEMGRLISPYLSDSGALEKIKELKKSLTEAHQASLEAADRLKKENELLERKVSIMSRRLNESLKDLESSKFQQYKDVLVTKLPTALREDARKKLEKATTVLEAKRIYMTVINESQNAKPSETTSKPVADKKPVKDDKVIRESADVTLTSTNEDVPDFDDETRRLARLD